MTSPRVLTGIDLPADARGGSVELLVDLYAGDSPYLSGRAFMLPPADTTRVPPGVDILDISRPSDNADFSSYVRALTTAIRESYSALDFDLLHLQHVAFGASLSLLRAFPDKPAIALIHGTDLIAAVDDPVQRAAFDEIVDAADVLVAPSEAMRQRVLASRGDARVMLVPWGLPDETYGSSRRTDGPHDPPRLLYAGRLDPAKGVDRLLFAPALHRTGIAVTASAEEIRDRWGEVSHFTSIGWQGRSQLWDVFDRFDALLVPSPGVEAFSLGAVEAQARGLPVLYQPTSGLNDVIADSGIPIDFEGDDLDDLLALPRLELTDRLGAARASGYVNAEKFRLGGTIAALTDLSQSLVDDYALRKANSHLPAPR